jgi:ABC-2 type transport system permease protein
MSTLSSAWLIAVREWKSLFTTLSGYLIVAGVLLLQGVLFNIQVLQIQKELRSADVVYGFFYFTVFTTVVAGVLVAMRAFTEEKSAGTMVLLETAPIPERAVVLGKFLGALLCVALVIVLSFPIPLLVAVNGKVQLAQLALGYGGTFLLAAVGVSVGLFASSLARSQAVAGVIAGVILALLFLAWMLSKRIDGNLGAIVGSLDLWDQHFRAFARGTLKLGSVVYYVGLTYIFLLATTVVVASRRWRA